MEDVYKNWGISGNNKRMFINTNGAEVIESGTYGNVKTVSAHITGLCIEDIDESDFKIKEWKYTEYPRLSVVHLNGGTVVQIV